MTKLDIETHLVKKIVKIPEICTYCKNKIPEGNTFHLEEGVKDHLHSLISRRFCSGYRYQQKKMLCTHGFDSRRGI